MTYGDPYAFNLGGYLGSLEAQVRNDSHQAFGLDDVMLTSEGRRAMTYMDPLLFALTYFADRLRSEDTGNEVTFSPFHIDLCSQALDWLKPLNKQGQYRDAYIAPRMCGKTTWLYLILPMWAAAHGHLKFVLAFSATAGQAEQWLENFRREVESNTWLRKDYPKLCMPATLSRTGQQIANNRGQIQQANGFTFMARGMDASVAGLVVGKLRPQLIILDDIEQIPEGGKYSARAALKRLTAVRSNVFYLNIFARVLMVGTVVMSGSIMHQLVQVVTQHEVADWVTEENIRVHYYPAILHHGDQIREASIWPERWPLSELKSREHQAIFKREMMNQPVPDEGAFWTQETITYSDPKSFGNTAMWIDPASTAKSTSDFTGIVVGSRELGNATQKVFVRHAEQVKLMGEQLRQRVLKILQSFPDIGIILVDTTNGGDTWLSVFHDMPVRLKQVKLSQGKAERIQQTHTYYEHIPTKVQHVRPLVVLETQMMAYPNVINDDLVDALAGVVCYFLQPKNDPRASAVQGTYV